MTPEEFLILNLEEKLGMSQEEASKVLSPDFNGDSAKTQKIYDCHEIQKILRGHPGTEVGRKLEEPCIVCAKRDVYCGYIDLGARDFYNNFWHICLNCLDAVHTENISFIGEERDSDFKCPYCGFER